LGLSSKGAFRRHPLNSAQRCRFCCPNNGVLDVLKDDILGVDKAGYVWVERQERASPTGWVALG
jgi:hypothetical protein